MPILGSGLMTHRAASGWWLSGGISAANCKAAYAPKGAASLVASYSNLNAPGTNDAAPGTAPTWDATNGWIFNGTNQYLTTGIVPAAGYSMIVRFSNLTSDGYLAGTQQTAAPRFFQLLPRATGNIWIYGDASKSGAGSTSCRRGSARWGR